MSLIFLEWLQQSQNCFTSWTRATQMWEKLLELNEWKVQQAKAWSAASQSTDCRSMRCRLRGSKSQLWLKSCFAYLRLFRVDASSLVLFCRHKVFPDSSVSAPSLFLVLTSRSLACWHFLIRSVVRFGWSCLVRLSGLSPKWFTTC